MSKRNLQPDQQADFHCSAEYHLAQSGSVAVMAMYALAYRVSKNSGVYSAAHGRVATYYNMDESTMNRAAKWIEDIGFFKKITSGKATCETNTYRVVSHKEWAKEHPGQCCTKFEMPWGQVDLGKQMYAASGRRVKFQDFQIRNYQKLGVPDEDILREWLQFLTDNKTSLDTDKKWRKSAGYLFFEELKAKFPDEDSEDANPVSSPTVDAVGT